MVGDVVRATAGKEKEQIFVVVKTEENYVYIADGKRLSVLKPKKKNVKHIEKVSKNRFLLGEDAFKDIKTDAAVRKFLRNEKERICQKRM